MTRVTSGPGFVTPFAFYDPATCSLRTSQHTLDLGSTESSPTLPRRGSMRSGELFARPTLALATAGTGSSSSPGPLLPTPSAAKHGADGDDRGEGSPDDANLWTIVGRLLPTPRTSDANGSGQHGEGGDDLRTALRLLPTPAARDGKGRDIERDGGPSLPEAIATVDWADYAPAIARHEATFGRPAPSPADDKGRLSPAFVEWMMALPEGWVTDVPGLSRSAQLRILGNGIVPRQAAHAWRTLLREALT